MDLLDLLTSESNVEIVKYSKLKNTRRARDVISEITKFENTLNRLERANRRAYYTRFS